MSDNRKNIMAENYELCSSVNRPTATSEPKVTLAYWNIRGLANTLRHLLEYLEVPYEDKRYDIQRSDDGTYNQAFAYGAYKKHKLNVLSKEMGFTPNLPYLIDGDHTFTQTRAIFKHIVNRFGRPSTLGGTDMYDQSHCLQIWETSRDVMMPCVRLAYGSAGKEEEFEVGMKALCEGNDMKNFINDIQHFLGKKKFLFSETELSMADFGVYDTLDIYKVAGEDYLKLPEDVTAYMENFENIAQIKNYQSSPDYPRYQLNNKIAVYEGNHQMN